MTGQDALLPFEAAADRARGQEFTEYLYDRCLAISDTPRQARNRSRRLWTLLQQWDRLQHELDTSCEMGKPTVLDYAQRWQMPLASANHAYAELYAVFPTERDPTRITAELWKGVGLQGDKNWFGGLMTLDCVKVFAR